MCVFDFVPQSSCRKRRLPGSVPAHWPRTAPRRELNVPRPGGIEPTHFTIQVPVLASRFALPVVALLVVSAAPSPERLPHPVQPPAAPVTAIVNVTLIDGTGAPSRAGVTVLLQDRRVRAIQPATAAVPAGATVVDGSGRFLIPGLIDAHVHLGTNATRPIETTSLVLGHVLMGGVTSIRDMGGRMATVRPLAEVASSDTTRWPRVYYSAIMAGPGSWFEGERGPYMAEGGPIGSSPLVRLVVDTTDIAAAVRAAKGAGATGLKVYNGIPLARLRAIVREARAQGLRVWSHMAVDPLTPSQLVENGVEVLSHADQFVAETWDYPTPGRPIEEARAARDRAFAESSPDSPEYQRLFAAMKRHGTIVDPTLLIMTPGPDSSGRVPARAANLYRFARTMTRGAYLAGVPIVAGTDAIGGSSPNVHLEMQYLADSVGMRPADVIVAATRTAARAIGIADSLGTIEPGKLADLVLLGADPTLDIANTQEVVGVFKSGRWYPRDTPMRLHPSARRAK